MYPLMLSLMWFLWKKKKLKNSWSGIQCFNLSTCSIIIFTLNATSLEWLMDGSDLVQQCFHAQLWCLNFPKMSVSVFSLLSLIVTTSNLFVYRHQPSWPCLCFSDCFFFRSWMDYKPTGGRKALMICAVRQVHCRWCHITGNHVLLVLPFLHLLMLCLSETDSIWRDYPEVPCFFFLPDIMYSKLFFFCPSKNLDCEPMNSKEHFVL